MINNSEQSSDVRQKGINQIVVASTTSKLQVDNHILRNHRKIAAHRTELLALTSTVTWVA
jgi:hypothetical protein